MWSREDLSPRLAGRFVTLEPLERRHVEGLREAASDERIWRFMVTTDVDAWIEQALADESRVQFVALRDGSFMGTQAGAVKE